MGCCHSFSILNDYFQILHPTSSVITNNRSAAISINGDTDDTIPLTSSKNKKSNRDLLNHNVSNFYRVIPLEERDPSSIFENVKDSHRFSSYTNKNESSSSSMANLENGLSNIIMENAFINQDVPLTNSDFDQNQDKNFNQNSNNRENVSNSPIYIHNVPDEIILSTEDEGGISGEMDSSFDDT